MNFIINLGNTFLFLGEIFGHIIKGHIRFGEVLKQTFEQGLQSVIIVILTSLATGAVLAMQGYVVLARFGAKEFIAQMVAWSLIRELGPVFIAIIFSAKAGARITAELGTMNVHDQILATRTLGVDPIEYLIVPRMLACLLTLPVLTIMAEIVGIWGGYIIGVYEAKISSQIYISQTFKAIRYVDFFSGFIKVFFFSLGIGWICCFQGFYTKGGSLGVGKFTAKAVAYSIIYVILSDVVLTKLLMYFWG
jgi:phospholipid/cholesterol/gamma-HCH transport system permease protein